VPVYEYRCENGHYYDKTEGFDAPRQQPCPMCGSTATRQISLPAVIFKGPGFYSTDNRGSSRGGNGKSVDSDTGASSRDGHGHSHGDGGDSHGSDSSKAEAAAE
jgi:putative FmdB family regulatory protein